LEPIDWAFIVLWTSLFVVAAVLYFTIGFGRFGWLLYF
jgi:hypothetical protein